MVDGAPSEPLASCAASGEDPADAAWFEPRGIGTEWVAEAEDGLVVAGFSTPQEDQFEELSSRFVGLLESVTLMEEPS